MIQQHATHQYVLIAVYTRKPNSKRFFRDIFLVFCHWFCCILFWRVETERNQFAIRLRLYGNYVIVESRFHLDFRTEPTITYVVINYYYQRQLVWKQVNRGHNDGRHWDYTHRKQRYLNTAVAVWVAWPRGPHKFGTLRALPWKSKWQNNGKTRRNRI